MGFENVPSINLQKSQKFILVTKLYCDILELKRVYFFCTERKNIYKV